MTPARRPRLALALLGAAGALLVAEGIARIHGDRLCAETPGAVYQADPQFGWRHVPRLAGWVGLCAAPGVPRAPVDANSHGLLDPERAPGRQPGRARILLLGGALAEGLGVREPAGLGMRESATVARVLELRADRRRGVDLEVINGATGGFALDNDLLYLRNEGLRFGAELVVVLLDPAIEVTALSPHLLRARGLPVPLKPYLIADGETLKRAPAVGSVEVPEGPPHRMGLLAHSQLYRLLVGGPRRSGSPVPLLVLAGDALRVESPEHAAERRRAEELTHVLLEALRDESGRAAAGLAVVVAPPRGEAAVAMADKLRATASHLGIPALDLAPAFEQFAAHHGRDGYLTGTERWDREGHFVAGSAIWDFLTDANLLPPGVVGARVLGGGDDVPALASLPGALADLVWRGRHKLFPTVVSASLLGVCLVWMGTILPAAGRNWLLAVVSLGLVGLIGTPALALLALAYGLAFYAAVERLPVSVAGGAALGLLVLFVVAPVLWLPGWLPAYEAEAREFTSFATNVALLRFAAYAFDRHRASLPELPLATFLSAMFFFPTFVNGPIESAAEFTGRRPPGGLAPESFAALRTHLRAVGGALVRLVWGACKVYAARLLFGKLDADIFATGGEAVGHLRLWAWTAELYLYFYIGFSGWTDVAIALGTMCGSTVAENFRAPWVARDVADFWNRWHITFGRWLKTYVYIPLGGNRRHVVLNVLAVFVVSGLWHVWGALKLLGPGSYPPPAWSGFLLWGLLNAVAVLLVHRWQRRQSAPRGSAPAAPGPRRTVGWRQVCTFVVVSLFWVPFFLPPWNRLSDCVGVLARLFSLR